MAKVLAEKELYRATDGNTRLHAHRIGIFNLMDLGEYPGQEDKAAKELSDELRRKGLVIEGDNEGQIRLTDKGIVESRRIDCSQRNQLEDWDKYQL